MFDIALTENIWADEEMNEFPVYSFVVKLHNTEPVVSPWEKRLIDAALDCVNEIYELTDNADLYNAAIEQFVALYPEYAEAFYMPF